MRRLGLMLVTVFLHPADSRAHDWNGMVMDSGGRIYVVDADYGEIWRIAKDGSIETFIDKKVGETLVHPHHLAIDAEDNLWVATNCIDVCVNRIFKIAPFARIGSDAGAVTVVGDMQLLVGDQGMLTLCDGKRETVVARDLGEIFGVAVDDAGNRFASDWKSGRIVKIDAAGTVTTVATALDHPSGMLVDKSRGLLVKESGRLRNRKFRILRVDPAGKTTVVVDANR